MKSKAIRKSNNKVTKKDKIKGWIFIILSILAFIIFIAGTSREPSLGGGAFIMILSIGLFWEGLRIRKGKKSILFTPSFNP